MCLNSFLVDEVSNDKTRILRIQTLTFPVSSFLSESTKRLIVDFYVAVILKAVSFRIQKGSLEYSKCKTFFLSSVVLFTICHTGSTSGNYHRKFQFPKIYVLIRDGLVAML